MSEWQPIDTAPKDGTDILLARETEWPGERFIVAGWFQNGWCTFDVPFTPIENATHWMPLPSPPKQEEAA